MKQKKKPKVFRTLVRHIHTGGKAVRDDGNEPGAKKKNDKQERQPPFFFGR